MHIMPTALLVRTKSPGRVWNLDHSTSPMHRPCVFHDPFDFDTRLRAGLLFVEPWIRIRANPLQCAPA